MSIKLTERAIEQHIYALLNGYFTEFREELEKQWLENNPIMTSDGTIVKDISDIKDKKLFDETVAQFAEYCESIPEFTKVFRLFRHAECALISWGFDNAPGRLTKDAQDTKEVLLQDNDGSFEHEEIKQVAISMFMSLTKTGLKNMKEKESN